MMEIENAQTNSLKPKTHILLIGVVLMILNFGISQFIVEEDVRQQLLRLLFALGFNVLIVFWCVYDSRERGETLGRYFILSVVIFGVFTLFYYFFKTRGFKMGLVSIGLSVLIFLGTILISSIAFSVFEAVR